MNKLSPNLMVKDVREAVEFYENLGFKTIMAVPESQDVILDSLDTDKPIVYALVKNGNVEIMFQASDSFKKDIPALKDMTYGASCSFYIEVKDVETLYTRVKNKVDIAKELFTTWYGMKEFYVRDNNGYILAFAEAKN